MLERDELEQAATWYVQMTDMPGDTATIAAWQRWLAASERHRQAWAQVQRLHQQCAGLTPDVALPTLASIRARRRQVAKLLGVLLVAGAAGTGALMARPLPARMAQYRTNKGERQDLRLHDGTHLVINAQSAVDIDYTEHWRKVYLHEGELLLETAPDAAHRPLLVLTAEGSVRALGTRFSVSRQYDHSTVQVFEHAVEVRPLDTPSQVVQLESGHQLTFDRKGSGPASLVPAASDAWTRGMLVAFDWPLGQVVEQLRRYRPGYLGCAPSAASLRITTTLRLDDSDAALGNLAGALPIRVRYLTPYWAWIDLA
ncbi:FecR domain-containing protein [Pseudomonas parafulva]|uniref:FecR domain-containing protein n=1 Tax=Pseudomonas parafulva TaxID=157782 RepID=UPI000406ED86|nr:FecR domain-containing protein [Pseudomonas parafulva]